MFNYSSVFLLNSCFFTFILRAEIVTSAGFLKNLSMAVENRSCGTCVGSDIAGMVVGKI